MTGPRPPVRNHGHYPAVLLLAAAWLAGCATPPSGPAPDLSRGPLVVQLRTHDKDGIRLEKPASIFADGVLLGSCGAPGEVRAELAVGPHQITIEVPWAWQLARGARQRAIALTGQRTVTIAGGGKPQVLIFELKALRKRTLAD